MFNPKPALKLSLQELSNSSGSELSYTTKKGVYVLTVSDSFAQDPEFEFPYNRMYKQYNTDGDLIRLFGSIKGGKQ